MPWRIIATTDNQHIGEVLGAVEPGQIITFEDGDVVSIQKTFLGPDGDEMVASGTNYQMTLTKE
jgi:hypothetical protein